MQVMTKLNVNLSHQNCVNDHTQLHT